jgi:hypothetical protein
MSDPFNRNQSRVYYREPRCAKHNTTLYQRTGSDDKTWRCYHCEVERRRREQIIACILILLVILAVILIPIPDCRGR